MKKALIISCVLALISSFAFAEGEKKGSIIGTFGLGASFDTTVETKTLVSMVFDLNLISVAGFTLCLTDVIGFSFRGDFSQNIVLFGPGYHYMKDKWNVGVSLLGSPTAVDMIIAGKIDGGYYFTDNIGITGLLMYGRTTGLGWDFSMVNVYAGVSIKL
ncbi:MAG: hypothetical protein LBK66_08805 [Spirochaetaceae bacterium]|jgi:hypothetical protein|nr:hypothetical protein [Spirochaetaceae bacterium]